jgi:hypothetical protein
LHTIKGFFPIVFANKFHHPGAFMPTTYRFGTSNLDHFEDCYQASIHDQKPKFPSIDKAIQHFRDQKEFDAIKFSDDAQKFYAFLPKVEIYSTKSSLRAALAKNSDGAWIEKKGDKSRYFVEENRWLGSSIKEVMQEDCQRKPSSTWKKVMALALGILAITPGAIQAAVQIPFSKEAAAGLLLMQQKNPIGGFLALSLLSAEVAGQTYIGSTAFQVNNITSSPSHPLLATLKDGKVVFVWRSGASLYITLTDPSGKPLKSEFLAVSSATSQSYPPAIAALDDGGFVLAWTGSDSNLGGIYKMKFDANATSVGGEVLVNTQQAYSQNNPKIAKLSGGGYIVTWTSDSQDGSGSGVYGQIYASNENRVGGEIRINSVTADNQLQATVAGLPNGGFVSTWATSPNGDGDGFGVFAATFDQYGNTQDSDFQVNTYSLSDQMNPFALVFPSGWFLITYSSIRGDFSNRRGIYYQIFQGNRTKFGSEITVLQETVVDHNYPQAALLEDGSFVFTFTGANGRIVHYNANRIITNNQYSIYTTDIPAITATKDGGYFVSWQATGPVAIFAHRLNATGFPIDRILPPNPNSPSPSLGANITSDSGTLGSMSSSQSITYSSGNATAPALTPTLTFSSILSNTSISTYQASSSSQAAQSTNSGMQSATPSGIQSNVDSLSLSVSPSPTNSSPQGSSSWLQTLSSFTQTSSQPSSTQSSSTTSSEKYESNDSGFPDWATALIAASAAACLGGSGVLAACLARKSKTKDPEDPENSSDSKEKILKTSKDRKKRKGSTINLSVIQQSDVKPSVGKQETATTSNNRDEANSSDQKDPAKPVADNQSKDIPKSFIFVPKHTPNVVPISELHKNIQTVGPNQNGKRFKFFKEELSDDDKDFIRQHTGYKMTLKSKNIGNKTIEGYFVNAGNFGVVWVGQEEGEKGQFVAIKEIQGQQQCGLSKKEAAILEALNGLPNIIPFFGDSRTKDGDLMYQFTHFAGFGNGIELARKLRKLVPERKQTALVDIAKGLLNGVVGMHSKNVFHLDLKWDNVVFDIHGETYIIDFGSARELPDGILQEYVQGDTRFWPPERFEPLLTGEFKQIPAGSIDAWGVGVTLLNIVKNRNCFEGQGFNFDTNSPTRLAFDQFTKFLKNELDTLPPDLPPKLAEVIRGLLRINPAVRMTVLDAQTHLKDETSYEKPIDRMTDFAKMKGLKLQEKR